MADSKRAAPKEGDLIKVGGITGELHHFNSVGQIYFLPDPAGLSPRYIWPNEMVLIKSRKKKIKDIAERTMTTEAYRQQVYVNHMNRSK